MKNLALYVGVLLVGFRGGTGGRVQRHAKQAEFHGQSPLGGVRLLARVKLVFTQITHR